MNNTQHTPGPWKAVQHPREHKWAWTIEGADGVVQSIARMGLVNDAHAVAANAHLIAAAPAMYEALQAMLDGILFTRGASMSEDRWRTLTTIARTTLAQAEGRDK